MTDKGTRPPIQPDPWEILGVPPGAPDKEVRQAYLDRLKDHPSDQDPEGFKRVRGAFARLRDPASRATLELDALDPRLPLAGLAGDAQAQPRFAGTKPWLALLRKE